MCHCGAALCFGPHPNLAMQNFIAKQRPVLLAGSAAVETWIILQCLDLEVSFATAALCVVGLTALNGLLLVIYLTIIYPVYLSPLRHYPGPKGGHFLFGNFIKIYGSPPPEPHLSWMNDWPDAPLIRFRGIFNVERIFPCSIEALRKVQVSDSYEFPKPHDIRKMVERLVGSGILTAEGDEHKRQRKILTPVFSLLHIKGLLPFFWEKSNLLVTCLRSEVEKNGQGNVIEMQSWLSKATLDIIGVAGFGYEFDSLHHESLIVKAFNTIFMPMSFWTQTLNIVNSLVPGIRYLPLKRNREVRGAVRSLRYICDELIEDRMLRVAKGQPLGDDIISIVAGQGGFTKEEMIGQMMTFLAAGHETTATAATWALHLLSNHLNVQERLRRDVIEAFASVDGTPDFETVDKLKFLSHVMMEVLRYRPPIPVTFRQAKHDSILEGYDIPKGTNITICNAAIQRDKRLWGPDADEFNPDRWENPPNSNFAFNAFLNGPRSCIGRR